MKEQKRRIQQSVSRLAAEEESAAEGADKNLRGSTGNELFARPFAINARPALIRRRSVVPFPRAMAFWTSHLAHTRTDDFDWQKMGAREPAEVQIDQRFQRAFVLRLALHAFRFRLGAAGALRCGRLVARLCFNAVIISMTLPMRDGAAGAALISCPSDFFSINASARSRYSSL